MPALMQMASSSASAYDSRTENESDCPCLITKAQAVRVDSCRSTFLPFEQTHGPAPGPIYPKPGREARILLVPLGARPAWEDRRHPKSFPEATVPIIVGGPHKARRSPQLQSHRPIPVREFSFRSPNKVPVLWPLPPHRGLPASTHR